MTTPDTENEIVVLKQQYMDLMHAMQTGIEYLKQYEPTLLEPKHMRVGVNSHLVSMGALVKLLIDKGVLTEHEYWSALVTSTREEVERYEAQLRGKLGGAVTLL